MNYQVPPPSDGPPHTTFFTGAGTQPDVSAFASTAPHRRAFSSFSNDAANAFGAGSMPSNMFSTDDLMMGFDEGGDQGDPKRRRIARACDMCRKKKIKCDGKMPACSHCQNYKTECVFTQVEKKRNPPKGAKYIEGLENRLGRMEALLKLSGLLSEEDAAATDLQTLEKRLTEKNASREKRRERGEDAQNGTTPSQTSTPGTTRENASPQADEDSNAEVEANGTGEKEKDEQAATQDPEAPKPRKKKGDDVEALSEAMCSLVTNNCGETRYIGSSSGFSIFSPKGIQWVGEKTGDTSFQDMISCTSMEDNKWIQWQPDVFGDIFQRRVYKPLPPKAEALSLLKDFFAHFNCMFPLFHEATFMHLVEKHYSQDPYEGSGWWASLNVALAIAHRLRVMSGLVAADEDQKAWGYLKNALAVQSELTIRNTDLLSVQALLGMSLFLMGTPNPQPSFFLVAAAIRLAHSIGLHKKFSAYNLNPAEAEQRKRVFWIAYMLDMDICLRSGRPPIQDDNDMNVELPSEDPADNIGNIPLFNKAGKVNLFRLMCQFAVIASKVYRQLYSVKASKQSDGELLNTIGELDRELEEWKDSIPIDFRPEHEIQGSHTPLILHVVVLHFAYYNCLTTIHRMSVHHGYWTSRLSNYAIQGLNVRPLNPRVFSSAALCVSAARASIHLIKYIPQGDFQCVWLILYYPVSSLVTLFANILQNPQDTRARSDIKLMNHVVEFLAMLCTDERNGAVRRMLTVCSEFERIAKVVLDKSDRESSNRRKRKQTDPETNKQTTPAPMPTPKLHHATSPTPTQPGNIPNVFSPPAYNMFTGQEATFASNGNGPRRPSTYPENTSPLGATSPQMQNAPNGEGYGYATPDRRTSSFVPPPGSQGTSPSMPGAMNGSPGMNMGYPPMAFGATEQLLMGNAFQHPFVPQDLWQMPMTLEWDWAGMTTGFGAADGGAAQSFEANGVMNNIPPGPPNGAGTPGASNGGN